MTAAVLGGFPGAALFFSTYETSKRSMASRCGEGARDAPAVHVLASSCAETMACLVRVPTENVKQKLQTGLYSTFGDCVSTIAAKRGVSGFYVGFVTTVMRELPFSAVQFPLYEFLKRKWREGDGRGRFRKTGDLRMLSDRCQSTAQRQP